MAEGQILYKVTLKGSPIGCLPRQRQTLRGLGLTRLGMTVVLPANPSIEGMIRKVAHLVSVES
jgi:large subunit ribosomal protein L30